MHMLTELNFKYACKNVFFYNYQYSKKNYKYFAKLQNKLYYMFKDY
jgi:hypothetical protein